MTSSMTHVLPRLYLQSIKYHSLMTHPYESLWVIFLLFFLNKICKINEIFKEKFKIIIGYLLPSSQTLRNNFKLSRDGIFVNMIHVISINLLSKYQNQTKKKNSENLKKFIFQKMRITTWLVWFGTSGFNLIVLVTWFDWPEWETASRPIQTKQIFKMRNKWVILLISTVSTFLGSKFCQILVWPIL